MCRWRDCDPLAYDLVDHHPRRVSGSEVGRGYAGAPNPKRRDRDRDKGEGPSGQPQPVHDKPSRPPSANRPDCTRCHRCIADIEPGGKGHGEGMLTHCRCFRPNSAESRYARRPRLPEQAPSIRPSPSWLDLASGSGRRRTDIARRFLRQVSRRSGTVLGCVPLMACLAESSLQHGEWIDRRT